MNFIKGLGLIKLAVNFCNTLLVILKVNCGGFLQHMMIFFLDLSLSYKKTEDLYYIILLAEDRAAHIAVSSLILEFLPFRPFVFSKFVVSVRKQTRLVISYQSSTGRYRLSHVEVVIGA